MKIECKKKTSHVENPIWHDREILKPAQSIVEVCRQETSKVNSTHSPDQNMPISGSPDQNSGSPISGSPDQNSGSPISGSPFAESRYDASHRAPMGAGSGQTGNDDGHDIDGFFAREIDAESPAEVPIETRRRVRRQEDRDSRSASRNQSPFDEKGRSGGWGRDASGLATESAEQRSDPCMPVTSENARYNCLRAMSFDEPPKNSERVSAGQVLKQTGMRVLTFNVGKPSREQLAEIAALVAETAVDVAVFQELSLRALGVLRAKLLGYQSCECMTAENYDSGIAIFCRKSTVKIADVSYYLLPLSKTGRHAIDCRVCLRRPDRNSAEFNLLGISLERGDKCRDVRSKQFKTLLDICRDLKKVVLVGDFALSQHDEPLDSAISDSNLFDAWQSFGCASACQFTSRDSQSRLKLRCDRILSWKNLKPVRMDLWGTELKFSDHVAMTVHFSALG
ncbi:MAG: endonuclease/exonuclease/phosphatase family protein [Sulfobacillus sp.]